MSLNQVPSARSRLNVRPFASLLGFLVLLTSIARAQSFTVVYQFSGAPDGANPNGSLIVDGTGNLYGTTTSGGNYFCDSTNASGGCGTVFKVDKSGTETVLHAFNDNPDGKEPYSGLLPTRNGTAYGTTYFGGSAFDGIVFEVDKTGKVTVVHNFVSAPDGQNPYLSALVQDSLGNLYGTTTNGGTIPFFCGCGIVFKIDPSGKETVLHRFLGGPGDGSFPQADLVLDSSGNVYGTTFFGGSACPNEGSSGGCGTIFKISPAGQMTVLYNFTGGTDGANPAGKLLLDSAGNLYGTTAYGAALCDPLKFGCGTIFKFDTSGKLTVLHRFRGAPDGANPFGGLIIDRAGNAYGVTSFGGIRACGNNDLDTPGCGTVYKLAHTGKFTILHAFDQTDGANPDASLVRDSAGILYGTTPNGGNPTCNYGAPPIVGCGTVFKITR
jgi:uncharacterized repeat protein (TIGR03803 family)